MINRSDSKTLIIAEAGVNHNGDLSMACELVDVAASAGADLVKFQTFRADRLVTQNARKAEYQIRETGDDGSQYSMLRQLELSTDMHKTLINHCKSRSIGFFSTAFDIESIDFLVAMGAEYFKIPSGEINNLPYLRHIGKYKKPVILSTGMSYLNEIGDALDVLEQSGTSRKLVTVLHCTTEYPTPMKDVNLSAMSTIQSEFGVDVGYSDHTEGIEVAIAAVAMGASVIEKHLTLDRTLPGPDHKASLEPHEFMMMVQSIRNIERSFGDGIKRPMEVEEKNRPTSRKSLVAACNIMEGDVFSENNLTVKRPGTGVSPMQWDNVLGKKASRSYCKDELIEL